MRPLPARTIQQQLEDLVTSRPVPMFVIAFEIESMAAHIHVDPDAICDVAGWVDPRRRIILEAIEGLLDQTCGLCDREQLGRRAA
jgi:hypothetical protein